MHFRTNAAPTGSGKTYAATTFACERIPAGMKTAILQPTIKLCQQSSFDAKKWYPGCKAQIRRIVSDSGVEQKVSGRITEYLNTRDAQALYERFGFVGADPARTLVRPRRDST